MNNDDKYSEVESARLQALRDLQILDTPADPAFDHVTALARQIFKTPIALVSLVDANRQWFKSVNGLDVSETPREVAFCDHAIRQNDVFVVRDAREDPRFCDNPLVTGEPNIRFYAGTPLLVSQGAAIGTLCIIDTKPREFNEASRRLLAGLAEVAGDAIRSHTRDIEASGTMVSNERLAAMVHRSANEFYVFSAEDFTFRFANESAARSLGYSLDELTRMTVLDIKPDFTEAEFAQTLTPLCSGESSKVTFETNHLAKSGWLYPVRASVELDASGEEPVYIAMVENLTDERAAEDEVRKTAALNQSILDSAMYGILSARPVFDPSGRLVDFEYVTANPANQSIIGLSPDELIGNRMLDLFPALEHDGTFDTFKAVVAIGDPAEFDLHFESETLNGWYRVSAVRSGADELTVTYTDISEAVGVRDALSELNGLTSSESNLEAYVAAVLELGARAFASSHGFVGRVERDVYTVMGAHGELNGVAKGDRKALDETLCAALVIENRPIAFHNMEEAPSACHPAMPNSPFNCYIGAPITVDGDLFGTLSFCNVQAKRREFALAEIELVRTLAESIAARVRLDQTQTELKKSRDELQFIFDNVPARIWYKDADNRILRLNSKAAESMNMRIEDATGADTYELFPEMARKYHMDDLRVLKSGEPLLGIEEIYTPRDGPHHWIRTDKVPLSDPDSNMDRLLVVSQDISELKDTQDELAKRNVALEGSNEDLRRFGSVVSHDLKAPLRHMKILSELLAASEDLPDESREYATLINESAERAQSMIRSLQSFSSLGRNGLKRTQTDLSELLKACIEVHQNEIESRDGKVIVGQVPQSQCDPELILQVLQNLTSNALRYGPTDQPVIELLGDEKNGVAEYAFIDNGPGIDAQYKEAIFEIFRRLPGSESRCDGEGVGLATCRRIIEAHGGKIWLDTDHQAGAKFVFSLPIAA